MIDSHCHIHGSEFDLDLSAVLDSARLSGVKAMLTVGTSPEDSARAVELAKCNVDIYCAIGIHPQAAEEFGADDVNGLRNLHCAKVLAVGETGFDLHYTPDTIALQRRLFIAHIELARELGLPLIIHDRDAHQQTMELLDEFGAWDLGGVMHCFSGDAAMAAQVVERGYYISVPKIRQYCAKRLKSFLLIGCLLKPTALIWLLCPNAASATSRPTCLIRLRRWLSCLI